MTMNLEAKKPVPLGVFSLVLLDFYQLYILWLDSNPFELHLQTFQKFAFIRLSLSTFKSIILLRQIFDMIFWIPKFGSKDTKLHFSL